MIDVGANEGLYTLLFVEMGATVISFEPDQTASQRLRFNLALNGYEADAREQAVYSSSGTVSLSSDRDTSIAIVDVSSDTHKMVTVSTTTIDDLVGDRHVRGIKVDVEGAELDVLCGDQRTMRDGRIGFFQLEWNDKAEDFGTSRSEIVEFIRSFGYSLCWPLDSGAFALCDDDIGSDVVAVRQAVSDES